MAETVLLNELEVSYLRYSRGESTSVHRHERAAFTFLMTGTLVERVRGLLYERRSPLVRILPAGTEHQATFTEASEVMQIEIESESSAALREIASSVAASLSMRNPRVIAEARQLAAGLRGGGAGGALRAEARALALLADVADRLAPPPWLGVVLRAIDREPRLATPERIAAAVGVDRATIDSALRVYYDASFRTIRMAALVQHAVATLLTARDPLAALATDLGFSDQAHMTRVIKRLTGATPGALRRRAAAPLPRPTGATRR